MYIVTLPDNNIIINDMLSSSKGYAKKDQLADCFASEVIFLPTVLEEISKFHLL